MDLKEYLEEHRLTYREFAESLEIHLFSLKNIVYGKRRPSIQLATKIELLTNGKVTVEDLLKEQPGKPTKRKSLKKTLR
ncbi:MAG: helix-turn-helix domain-containing protein [Parachlamydia sp.]|jgi:plasmid maintenance system antidote protein VapI|nr:helix-turn-helix domain-containing protein [Parachlamydia sp.]